MTTHERQEIQCTIERPVADINHRSIIVILQKHRIDTFDWSFNVRCDVDIKALYRVSYIFNVLIEDGKRVPVCPGEQASLGDL